MALQAGSWVFQSVLRQNETDKSQFSMGESTVVKKSETSVSFCRKKKRKTYKTASQARSWHK